MSITQDLAHNGRRWLSTLGVPRLRSIFLEVFGHHTASNNGAWLRRKLAEPAEGGRGRAVQIRARDASAAIWTTGRVKGVSKVRHTHAIPAAALESHKAFCLLQPASNCSGHQLVFDWPERNQKFRLFSDHDESFPRRQPDDLIGLVCDRPAA